MKPLLHRLTLGALLVFATGSALTRDKSGEAVGAGYEGTLGSQRIGMTLTIKDGNLIPDSHYFYQKDLTDIPLNTYPVALTGGGGSGPVDLPGTRWYRDVTDKSDTAFEAQVQGFYKAVMAGDRVGTARYVSFPLKVNFSPTKHLEIKTHAELSAHPAWLKKAADAMPHDMAVIKGQAMLGQGLAFFGDDGAEVINAEN